MNLNPWIGITDFMNQDEVRDMLEIFSYLVSEKPEMRHKLMVGVMMSYKTLRGERTRWAEIFPPKETIADIFLRHKHALNTLHYVDYEGIDVSNALSEAITLGGMAINAIQLDMIWPDPDKIVTAVAGKKGLSVILQVGVPAFAQASNNPREMIARLREYYGVIDAVLFDRSMGQGRLMDPATLLAYVTAVYEEIPTLRVSLAGGLGPGTVQVMTTLVRKFPDISMDAQSRLRPSGDARDPIDWRMATQYVTEAVALFTR